MFARFDENPAMTLQDIKKTKRYGRTDARTDVKTVYPPQTKFAGGIIINVYQRSKSLCFFVNVNQFIKIVLVIPLSRDTSVFYATY